jgi:2,3-bisphosphoglycerate-independent phosphoglycerate mutase
MARTIFFLIDGLADKGINTPLQSAKKVNISKLLNKSFLTQIFPLSKKDWPETGEGSVTPLANLGILGYKNLKKIKRGPLEAIGSGIKFKNGYLALRVDFSTVDKNLKVINRRAGRNTYGLDKLTEDINSLSFDVPFYLKRVYGHRGVLIFKKHLSANIKDSDPYQINKKVVEITTTVKNPLSLKTAKLVQEFLNKTYLFLENHPINKKRQKLGIPKANYLLTREAGNSLPKLKNFFKKFKIKNGLVIAENGAFKGTCKLAGFKEETVFEIKDIKKRYKFYKKKILENEKKYNLIYLHLKEADEASHDKNFLKKKWYIEFFDKWFGELMTNLKSNPSFIITCDHITDSKTGKHLWGPVPLIIINNPNFKSNLPKEFSEKEAKRYKKILGVENLWRNI